MKSFEQDTDYLRVGLAIFLAAALLMGWQAYVEAPRRTKLETYQQEKQAQERIEKEARLKEVVKEKTLTPEENPKLSAEERLKLSPRLMIRSDKLHGSIALKGARFDHLTLAKYRAEIGTQSPEVTLLAPNGDENAYFAQIGWLATDGRTKVPDQASLWEADKPSLSAGETVDLRWNNGAGVTFIIEIALDWDYMFTLTQRVENQSATPANVAPYGYINRTYAEQQNHYGILHEGPMGTMDGTLNEISYKDLRKEMTKTFDDSSGWLGITDKYWLAALIPGEGGYKTTFSHYVRHERDHYQVDYLGKTASVEPGKTQTHHVRFFAGAKEIDALDRYAEGCPKCEKRPHTEPIPLFDRAVDFGSLYFLTKPLFLMLKFFYALIGNFGIAIMLLTIVVKVLMYPLANKSYHAMAQMKKLQPEMTKIRERYADDAIAMNKEMMALYKREKVNPASGCMPVLLQMPVFFALYKVLYVTIEMRHAPFFGWIKDLSATDPSNIFTAFGLIPWDHPAALHIGILPILFCATMVIQMKQQPKPADPVQAKMMAIMPYFFLYLFASFPAGLVLYWLWSNILSIGQQQIITARHNAKRK